MGHRGSKIGFDGIIGTDFDLKIIFPPSIRVRNVTFDRFLKIFGHFQNKKNQINVKNVIFSKPTKKRSEPVKKSKY